MLEVQLLPWADEAEQRLEGHRVVSKVLLHRSTPAPEGRADWWATGLLLEDSPGSRAVTFYDARQDRLELVPWEELAPVEQIADRPTNT